MTIYAIGNNRPVQKFLGAGGVKVLSVPLKVELKVLLKVEFVALSMIAVDQHFMSIIRLLLCFASRAGAS